MPAMSFITAICSGHGNCPPRHSDQGSPDVFCNGKSVNRVGDTWERHPKNDHIPIGKTTSGSSTVFCNGIPIGRIGDDISCGSVIAEGSETVFCG